MDEPGLTHISLSCDVDDVRARVEEYGGEVLTETDIEVAVFIRDPDGQLIELLPLEYADRHGESVAAPQAGRCRPRLRGPLVEGCSFGDARDRLRLRDLAEHAEIELDLERECRLVDDGCERGEELADLNRADHRGHVPEVRVLRYALLMKLRAADADREVLVPDAVAFDPQPDGDRVVDRLREARPREEYPPLGHCRRNVARSR